MHLNNSDMIEHYNPFVESTAINCTKVVFKVELIQQSCTICQEAIQIKIWEEKKPCVVFIKALNF